MRSAVTAPKKRILPDPKQLNKNPSTLGKTHNSERTLTPAEPIYWEIPADAHVKRKSDNAPTASAANPIPATVSWLRVAS